MIKVGITGSLASGNEAELSLKVVRTPPELTLFVNRKWDLWPSSAMVVCLFGAGGSAAAPRLLWKSRAQVPYW